MAPAGKNSTPGRRKRTREDGNQYFDVGKVGRKTGITLKDTGIRDEHGLEPVSGIFSSPAQNGDRTLTSEGMDVEDSSAQDVKTLLSHRKTPRLPPPRQSTPKHTNIGSPKRMSSVKPGTQRRPTDDESPRANTQPPANRRLDFGATNRNRKSISVVDTRSPFVPKKVLRRSTGPGRPDPFDLPNGDEPTAHSSSRYSRNAPDDESDEDVEQSIEGDEGPILYDDVESYPAETEQTAVDLEQNDQTEAPGTSDSPLRRKRGRPRKSDQSLNSSQIQSSTKKRGRTSLEQSEAVDETGASAQDARSPPSKRKRVSNINNDTVHFAEATDIPNFGEYVDDDDENVVDGDTGDGQQNSTTDAQAQLDSQLAEGEAGPSSQRKRGRPKKGKAAAPKDRSKNPAQQNGSPVKLNDSPSKRHRGGSAGPVSNVNLRATTPFEDSGQQTSRFGRNLIQPLKYWENEAVIWKAGEIEGIVRAEHVDKQRPKKPKKRKGRKTARDHLDDIDEESDTESIMPDEWEETMGVLSGQVAGWDPINKRDDPTRPVDEDLAFAASSIVTRDVAGSAFKYAKIMTIPFFGAGVVELPPEGFKRAKNSRKMQMVFFVHSGKVMVEVGANGLEVNKFALSKGGVWVVPRGNNYSITNDSRTRDAKIFFAQGCEVEATLPPSS